MLNKDEILVLVYILKMAYARIGARESLRILPYVAASSLSLAGIELVTMT